MTRHIRHITGAAAVASAIAIAATSIGLGPSASADEQRPLNIVAVGDSYASGEGAIGSGWSNVPCHRSALAGPQNATARLIRLRPGTSFMSAACSGANTTHIIDQLNSMSQPNTIIDAVTMSIGGNNIGFAPLTIACANPTVTDCTSSQEAIDTINALTTLPATLDALFADINTRPEIRNVFVTEYPDPTTGLDGVRCGSLGNPGFQGLEFISENEAAFASASVVMPLNDALANAVTTANAASGAHPRWHFVSGVVSRFTTHGYCTGAGGPIPDPWLWTNPRFINTLADSFANQIDHRGTMHPNHLGQEAIGDALFDAMTFLAGGISVGVSSTPTTPIAGLPATLTVQATDGAGNPVPGAAVEIDGQPFGTTNGSGTLAGTHVFPTEGTHTVTVKTSTDSLAAGTVNVTVDGRPYTVTSSPSPIPIDRTISTLVVTTTDTSGAPVPGVFTLVDGRRVSNRPIAGERTRTFRNGVVNTGWTVNKIRRDVEEFDCPTLYFTPDSQSFTTKYVSELIWCLEA